MKLVGCVLDQHDPWLLALAAFMSVLACLTTCALLSRAQVASGRVRGAWLALAGLEFGGGVWALHFVAMLAYMPHVRFGYALLPTAASAAVAIVVAGCAFALLLAPGRGAPLAAAVLLTAGIAGMHYTGVAALRVPGRLSLDAAGVAWSVAVCFAAVLAALRPLRTLGSAGQFGPATALLVLAVCGLHFQGMAALTVELGGPGALGALRGMDTGTLAACVSAVGIVMMCVSLGLTVVDRHLSQRLTQEKQRLRQLVGMSFEGLLIERNGVVLDANQRLCELAGRPSPDIVGAPLHRLALSAVTRCEAAGGQPKEHRLLRSDGIFVPVECLVRPVSYEGRAANAVAVRDLSDRHRNEAALVHLAHHDSLTGLPNRLLLGKRIDAALAKARTTGGSVAVLCLDLDGFKEVNDLMGHAAGDKLLEDVARRLERELRAGDTLARLGGDEFVVVLDSPGGTHEAVANRLVEALGGPVWSDGRPAGIGASAGVAVFPAHADTAADLLRCADIALYSAKGAGRNTVRVFEPEMDRTLKERQSLESDLRQAIADQALQLHYQPLLNADDGRIEGYEALLRWQHPVRGVVPPSVFIPLAEEKHLIEPLGRWMLETACREAAGWDHGLVVAVNLSPRQFRAADLPEFVSGVLGRTGLDPSRLELEITEGVLVDDPEQAGRLLSTLRARGVRVSLDEFGTGYSSLRYLQHVPLDRIKINRSFVASMAADARSAAIVGALIALAHTLGLSVTVEGVETEGQLAELQRRQSDQVQGFRLGRPTSVPAGAPAPRDCVMA